MELFDSNTEVTKRAKKGGPPNRINDLNYTDWMKFQKSFFRELPRERLYTELVTFFTKSSIGNVPSRSLIFTIEPLGAFQVSSRHIETDSSNSIEGLVLKLLSTKGTADFVLVDVRGTTVAHSILGYTESLYSRISELLLPERFCCVLYDLVDKNGGGYPVAWTAAMKSRDFLRLKDEKVSINEVSRNLSYVIVNQKLADGRTSKGIPTDLQVPDLMPLIPNFVIPKPPPRSSHEILHPAKYPETLVSQFIDIFCKKGGWVFDPMAGTGSTLIAAIREKRNSIGVELSDEFAKICHNRIQHELRPGLYETEAVVARVVQGNSLKLDQINDLRALKFDYVITSPPYWSMLQNKGSENQKKRRDSNLKTVYSDSEDDLGNVQDYDLFLQKICKIYNDIYAFMNSGSYLTIVVKNVKRDHILYTLAWDLVMELSKPNGKFAYVGNTLWLQDDIGLKPFGIGTHWVSNILHHYCLHFKKE